MAGLLGTEAGARLVRPGVAGGGAGGRGGEAKAAMAGLLDTEAGARFVELELEEKWTGGLRHVERLAGFPRHDTQGRPGALDADAHGELGSRARFSLRVVEGLLDALGLEGERRLNFYRESFDWALERGRWDPDVIASLEQVYANQRGMLAEALEVADDDAAWPSATAARIGRRLVAGIGEWAAGLAGAP